MFLFELDLLGIMVQLGENKMDENAPTKILASLLKNQSIQSITIDEL